MERNEWQKISELSRHIIWSDNPKNKKKLEKIRVSYTKESSSKALSDVQREAILKAQKEYNGRVSS